MKLIADSGSTKTDWVLASPEGTIVSRQKTEGINPVHQAEDAICQVLHQLTISCDLDEGVAFYGSGLRAEYQPMMRNLLARHFRISPDQISADSDMMGAARALCGHNEGIACILGTGSNSCLFDGERIIGNTPALGYILGDEGSGAVLGRELLNQLYKGRLPQQLKNTFEEEMQMNMSDVIMKVYRTPLANRWLASLTMFISSHIADYPQLDKMVTDCFRQFYQHNILPYRRKDLPVGFVGSIAWYFKNQLMQAASEEGLCISRIEQSPMNELLLYHKKR